MTKCEKCGLYLTQSEIDRRKCDNCNREMDNSSLLDQVAVIAIANSLFEDSSPSSIDTSSSDSSFEGFGGGDFGGGGADSSW